MCNKMPILTSVFLLIMLIAFFVRRGKDKYAQEQEDFWERERRANSTRRKSLDGLNYLTIPWDRLPTEICTDDERIAEYIDTIRNLKDTKIVNLTGISNTDLKLQYGAPNITELTIYDQRYTALASTLQRWADALIQKEQTDAARTVLEYAVETGTDVSGSYKLLADIYDKEGNKEAIRGLLPTAEALNTPMKEAIIRSINERL